MLVIFSFAVAGRRVREVRDDTSHQVRSGQVRSEVTYLQARERWPWRPCRPCGPLMHVARGTEHVARADDTAGKRRKRNRWREKEKGQLKVTSLPGFVLRASRYRQKGHKRGSVLVALMPFCRWTSEINAAFVLPWGRRAMYWKLGNFCNETGDWYEMSKCTNEPDCYAESQKNSRKVVERSVLKRQNLGIENGGCTTIVSAAYSMHFLPQKCKRKISNVTNPKISPKYPKSKISAENFFNFQGSHIFSRLRHKARPPPKQTNTNTLRHHKHTLLATKRMAMAT